MNYFEIIRKCPLFNGIDEAKLLTLLKCIGADERQYEKNSYIFHAEDSVSAVGVVLSGSVQVVKDDFWGRRTILARMGEGELFAEAFSCAEINRLPFSIIAAEKSAILFIDYKRIVTTCTPSCEFHTGLIKNMMKIIANKNVKLTYKIEHITRKSTREKLLSYLSSMAMQEKSKTFTIPFSRQELADYLSVDRSAMSNELSKMRDEGILEFYKNQIELFDELRR